MVVESGGARIGAIYIAGAAGSPMESLGGVAAIAGVGLEGDRYANGIGAFSRGREAVRHITLIARSAIVAANEQFGVGYTAADTRRNVVIDGIEPDGLNDLVGVEFSLGDARLRGTELCNPCDRPDKLSGKHGFRTAFDGIGGLRAEIVADGYLGVGDLLVASQVTRE